jgi:hypothetical protein
MKKILIAGIFLSALTTTWAQMLIEDFAFSARDFDSSVGVLASFQGEKFQSATTPELHPLYKIEFFLQETKDIWASILAANISPISANVNLGIAAVFKFTPSVLLSLPVNFIIGTGWYDSTFGPGVGIISNFYDPNVKENSYSHENLSKAYFKTSVGSQLTFTIIPNTIEFTAEQTLYYRYFLGTKSDNDIWLYENQGDNLKYFRYTAGGMISFFFPLFFHRLSLFGTSDWDIQHYGASPVSHGGWGSDLPIVRFGTVIGMSTINEKINLDLQLAWGNTPAYQEGYGYNIMLTERRIDTTQLQYWYLHKIALLLSIVY